MLRNFESTYDATVIQRLKKEDALLIGRTNMDEFAMGSSTENSIYGPSRNPVNTDYVTGGSSGGSAAVVAAGMCDVALGSDTGGSIRQPASYCGVVGLKPTYSRVSRYGLVAFASSFDSIGPFSNNVTDAAQILTCIAGNDPMDNSTSDLPVDDYLTGIDDFKRKLRVGVPEQYFGDGLDPEIRKIIEENKVKLPIAQKLGHRGVVKVQIIIAADGSKKNVRFISKTQYESLNESAKKSIDRIQFIPAPPKFMRKDTTINFSFLFE
jgi:aspartyl-tRNA(Asn)/glutamyl-tRNA(Gln) amidotransferase subunit A